MHCSNPDCRLEARDLHSGVLRLMEMEVPPEERLLRADSGFPVVAVPVRPFWLCGVCARLFRMKRWTRAGLILEARETEAALEAGGERHPAKFGPGQEASAARQSALESVA